MWRKVCKNGLKVPVLQSEFQSAVDSDLCWCALLREDLTASDEAESVVAGLGQVVAPKGQLEVVVAYGEPCVEHGVEGL